MQHPSVPGIVFAGTTEGFWRSDKGGDADSWMVTTSRQLEINSIAVHPSRPDMVYIGTNNYGMMVSNDGGKSFTPSNGGFSGRFAYAILADRETPNRIYASTINTATGGGFLFVSNDNGETWRPSMRSMPSRLITYAIVQDTRDANLLYLGTNLGVYRSIDRGATWAPVWANVREKEASQENAAKTPTATAARARRPAASAADETILQAQQALLTPRVITSANRTVNQDQRPHGSEEVSDRSPPARNRQARFNHACGSGHRREQWSRHG